MKHNNIIKMLIICIIPIIIFIILKFDLGIPCIFNKVTRLYCPGCGATRAIKSLLNFDIYKALRYNMLIVMLLPSIVMLLFYKYILKGKKKIPNFVWCFLLVLTILFGILRNIPYFYYLAPN